MNKLQSMLITPFTCFSYYFIIYLTTIHTKGFRCYVRKEVMYMRLCSIASGSSGNCIYVGSETTHLLIDVGVSAKRIEGGLKEIGIVPDALSGILITHEHSDHIQGLGVMARRYQIPV